MKKLLSIKYSTNAFNVALFLFRICVGANMMTNGYNKLINFGNKHEKFMNFLGMGSTLSLALVVFAEFFCSLFIILGLFTRLATIPLIITIGVPLFKVHKMDFFGEGELAALYLGCYILLLLLGPGKASVDNLIGK